MNKTSAFALIILLSFSHCKNPSKQEKSPAMIKDVHSFALPEEAVIKHLDLDINVDFNTKTISGKAGYEIENKGSNKIILDTKGLKITKVTVGKGEMEASFSLGAESKFMGKPLEIKLKPEEKYITIYYSSDSTAEALQWLNPQQTAGKHFPFLFTQSQAILARTWIPIQDSPGIRFTYNAKVHVPKEMIALMSAENPTKKNKSGEYEFKMEQPVPAYLMALAVGDIEFKNIGKRTGVYAEPVTLDKAVYEFGEMEQMLESAEKLYGKYAWGRYDVLMLPPSFPFGGMENPRLTFATPTILAGDRSLVSLVAHELAHSWSGNLVTNATWNDFWLNEGFTVYFERRIMESISGAEYAEMLAELGFQDLKETMADLGAKNEDTKLKLNLEGRNPDDGVSDIAYEKGFLLLKLIDNKVGREKFDHFLKTYFEKHAFGTTNTEDFLKYLKENLLTQEQYKDLKVDEWVYSPGLPSNCPEIKSKRFKAVEDQIKQFEQGTSPEKLNTANWTSHEWLHFVRNLPENISISKMNELDKAFHFTNTGNSEILFAWLELSIERNYSPANQRLEEFLTTVGRRKFLTPLYKALIKTPAGKEKALAIYKKARPNYHFVATSTIDELLGWHAN